MAQTLVLDASVLIAWFDDRDGLHTRAVAFLRKTRTDDRVVPATVHAESLVVPFRIGEDAVAAFDAALDALPARVVPITRTIARRAASLRSRHAALRFADALVIATAHELGGVPVTGDRAWRRYDPHVRIL